MKGSSCQQGFGAETGQAATVQKGISGDSFAFIDSDLDWYDSHARLQL